MPRRVRAWFEERWPITAVLHWGMHEEIPGGARFAYVLGSSTLFLFTLQAITGVWQMFYYVPTVDHAYESVTYLRQEVEFGWLVHGLHYWGASAFLIVMGIHAARVFIWGAYKKPRELTWLIGVLLLIAAAGLMFTGALLPWDLMGYWAGEVGTSVAGTVPLVGEFVKSILRGGERLGQLALSRFFVLHVAILPAITVFLIVLHMGAFRRAGSVGPWLEAKRTPTGWFWPEQAFRDMIAIALLLLLLVGLTAYFGAPFTGPADDRDTIYVPKPEWNFLFLYQFLKYFRGPWELVGTVAIPSLIVLLLLALPFVDRNPERNPRRRPVAMLCGLAYVGGILALTLVGYFSTPESGELSAATAPKPAAPAVAPSGPETMPAAPATAPTTGPATTPTTGPAVSAGGAVARGEALFTDQGCNGCHSVTGGTGTLGPDLSGEGKKGRAREWLLAQLRDPKSHNPNSIMPPYAQLSPQQLNDLTDYLMSLKAAAPTTQVAGPAPGTTQPSAGEQNQPGLAARFVGDSGHGKTIYEQYCLYCHGKDGVGGSPNPGSEAGQIPPLKPIASRFYSPDPLVFAENIDRVIQNGSKPAGPAPQFAMPAFGTTGALTQPQIANIEAYVMQLNGVDRARILRPGVQPHRAFFYAVAAVVAAGVIITGLWLAGRRWHGGG